LVSNCEIEDQQKLDEYLETCAFVIFESFSDANGLLLRGS